jgi:hypothetical protein
MRRARWGRLEGLANDFGDIVIANLPRRSGTRFVEKPHSMRWRHA